MKFIQYFTSLGYTENDAHIWKSLFSLGTQPASVIAKETGFERTYVYKSLMKLSDDGVVSLTEKNGIKNFFIPDSTLLLKKTRLEKEKYTKLEDEYGVITAELASLTPSNKGNIPKITIYEGKNGIENLYEKMYIEIHEKKYREIVMFASNITESCGGSATLGVYADDFFEKLSKEKISIETYIGNGISLLESIGKLTNQKSIQDLPASNGSIQCFIIGRTFYLTIFKNTSFGMRIESDELSGLFRFLLENMMKKK